MSPAPATGPTPRVRPPKGGRRYRMTVAYDGTDFYGWQAQPNKRTVQGELEAALKQLTGEIVRVHSCGRTDTGVHARAQVAHFDLARPWETWKLQKGLNALLPPPCGCRICGARGPISMRATTRPARNTGFPSGTRR